MLHVLRITAGENIRKVIMNFETKDYPLKSKGFITSIQMKCYNKVVTEVANKI